MVRTTQDSDIIAEMKAEHILPFVAALEDEFYIDDEMIASAIQHNSSFNIIRRETIFKVDVFIPRPRPFLKSQLIRAQKQTFIFAAEVSASNSWSFTLLSSTENRFLGQNLYENYALFQSRSGNC